MRRCLQKGNTFGLFINYLNYNNMVTLIILFLIVKIVSNSEPYRKVIHMDITDAKCLDGSPAALYLHEADPKKILFYMQGGGVCGGNSLSQTLQNCYQRSKTIYGSSLYWPQTTFPQGILSTNTTKNIFANWTKVILVYCDGAFHQGMTKEPYSYKDTKLYFRGAVNTRAHFQYIHNRFDLNKAEKIILSGSSAGGIAALAWSNYLKNLATNTNLQLIADSAVLLRIDIKQLTNIFKVSNVDEKAPNEACANQYGKDFQWRCLTFEGILPFTAAPTIFLQSAYDSFIISQRLYINCLSEGEYGYSLANCSQQQRRQIEQYRKDYLNYIAMILSYGHSIWSIDCSQHSFANFDHFYSSPNLKVPMTLGRTMEQAIFAWIFQGKQVVQVDLDGWPNNSPCSQ